MIQVSLDINQGNLLFNHSLYYDNDKWVLEDGNSGRTSTNGTWLFVDDFYPLQNGTVFKAGQTLYGVKLIN